MNDDQKYEMQARELLLHGVAFANRETSENKKHFERPDSEACADALFNLILEKALVSLDGDHICLANWFAPFVGEFFILKAKATAPIKRNARQPLGQIEQVRIALHESALNMPAIAGIAPAATTGWHRADVAAAIVNGLKMAEGATRASSVPEMRHYCPSLTQAQGLNAARDLAAALEAVRANPLFAGLATESSTAIGEQWWTPALYSARTGRVINCVHGPEWQPYSLNEKTVADTVLTPGADPLACLVEYARSIERGIAADHGPQRVNPDTAVARSFFDDVLQQMSKGAKNSGGRWPKPMAAPVYDLVAVIFEVAETAADNARIEAIRRWSDRHEQRS